jgi:outer membrane murein-binding lipoprotein Lpp
MNELTEARLAEIEARCEAATPGPWYAGFCLDAPDGAELYIGKMKNGETADVLYAFDEKNANAAFMADARSDIPALLAYIWEIESDRNDAREEADADRRSYAQYVERATAEMKRLEAERDALRRQVEAERWRDARTEPPLERNKSVWARCVTEYGEHYGTAFLNRWAQWQVPECQVHPVTVTHWYELPRKLPAPPEAQP